MSVNKKELIILQRRQIHSAVKKGEYCDGLKTLVYSIDITIQYYNCVNLRKDKINHEWSSINIPKLKT